MSVFNLESFTGGGGMSDQIVDSTVSWMKDNKQAAALLVVLAVVALLYVVWLMWVGKAVNPLAKEPAQAPEKLSPQNVGVYQSGNPTGLAATQVLDTSGHTGEGLGWSAFNPNAENCKGRGIPADEAEAWSWMGKEAASKESMTGVASDNALSAILASQRPQ